MIGSVYAYAVFAKADVDWMSGRAPAALMGGVLHSLEHTAARTAAQGIPGLWIGLANSLTCSLKYVCASAGVAPLSQCVLKLVTYGGIVVDLLVQCLLKNSSFVRFTPILLSLFHSILIDST